MKHAFLEPLTVCLLILVALGYICTLPGKRSTTKGGATGWNLLYLREINRLVTFLLPVFLLLWAKQICVCNHDWLCSDGHKKGGVQEVPGERRRPRIFNKITGKFDRSKTFFQNLVKNKRHISIFLLYSAQVSLYEADKPNSALDYLKNNFSGKETEILQLKVSNLTRWDPSKFTIFLSRNYHSQFLN